MRYLVFVEEQLRLSLADLRTEAWVSHSMPEYGKEVARWVSSLVAGRAVFYVTYLRNDRPPEALRTASDSARRERAISMSFLGIPRCLPLG